MSASTMPAVKHRRHSRSSSFSSSLLTLKKKNPPVSTKTNPRSSLLRSRPTSPPHIQNGMTPSSDLLIHALSSNSRRGSDVEDARSIANRNITRWSHLTSSSNSNIDTDTLRKRLQDSSRRMSIRSGVINNSFRPETNVSNRPKSRQTSPDRLDPMLKSPRSKFSTEHLYSQSGKSPSASMINLTPTSMF